MAKLFNKNRYTSVTSRKFSQYLLYAAGEIVLVVIGILIALQINISSEKRQQQAKVRSYLEQFRKDLERDVETLDQMIANNTTRIRNVDSIQMLFVTRQELNPAETARFIRLHQPLVYESYFVPETGTYKQLVAGGHGDYFRNEALRTQLFAYYSFNEQNEKNNEVSTQLYMHNYFAEHIYNTILLSAESFELQGAGSLSRPPMDYTGLIQQTPYVSAVVRRRGNAINQNGQYRMIRERAQALLDRIGEELFPEP